MNNLRDTKQTQRGRTGHVSASADLGVNDVLPMFGAVLNKLAQMGIRCEARPDDAHQSLIIEVFGATAETTPEGRIRFVMRQGEVTP